jgi:chromosome segregation ATPase
MIEAELVKMRDELRTAQATIELGNTQASQARTEAEAAETALARRDAEIDLLRATLAERTAELSERTVEGDAAHTQWEQITAELTGEIEMARAESAQFQRAAADLELVLVDTRLELETLQMIYGQPSGSTDPDELRRALNAAAAEIERLRAAQ